MTRKTSMQTWKKPKNLVVIGYGHWGQALGQCFSDAGYQVQALRTDSSDEEWNSVFKNEALVLLSCPFEFVSAAIQRLSKEKRCVGVINASKGIDRKSLKTFTPLAKIYLKFPIASLSGPSFAEELRQRQPTACVLAGSNKKFVQFISEKISRPYFRIYTHSDPIGIEVCGAVKNILAIACGISDGLGFGENARAALLTRALPEMMKIARALGGKPASVFGLAGVGDLWLTASGSKSRNRRFGILLGSGTTFKSALQEIGETVEGVYTLEQIEKLRRKYKIDLPICKTVHEVVFKEKSPAEALKSLMSRSLKAEESSSWKLN